MGDLPAPRDGHDEDDDRFIDRRIVGLVSLMLAEDLDDDMWQARFEELIGGMCESCWIELVSAMAGQLAGFFDGFEDPVEALMETLDHG